MAFTRVYFGRYPTVFSIFSLVFFPCYNFLISISSFLSSLVLTSNYFSLALIVKSHVSAHFLQYSRSTSPLLQIRAHSLLSCRLLIFKIFNPPLLFSQFLRYNFSPVFFVQQNCVKHYTNQHFCLIVVEPNYMLKSLPDLCLHTPTFILYSNQKKLIGEIIHTELLIFHHVMPLGSQAVRMQQNHTVRILKY